MTYAAVVSSDGQLSLAGVDTLWVLAAAGCVVLMQAGYLLLSSGYMRRRNAAQTVQKGLLAFTLGVVTFATIGMTLSFGRSGNLPFGTGPNYFLLDDLAAAHTAFALFQIVYCGLAVTIVAAAVAHRLTAKAFVIAGLGVAGVGYPLFQHWAKGSAIFPNATAFLDNLGFVDLGGGVTIYATSGWIGLAALMVIGRGKGGGGWRAVDTGLAASRPSLVSAAGVLPLVVGWSGLNGGAALLAGVDALPVVMMSLLAAGAGGCSGYLLKLQFDRSRLPQAFFAGMLGGLAAVTSGVHLFSASDAMLVGLVGGSVSTLGNAFARRIMRLDDPGGMVGAYALAGVIGALALPLVAAAEVLPAGDWLDQLRVQAVAVGINFYWAFGGAYLFFRLLDRVIVLRDPGYDEALDEEEGGLHWARPYEEGERVAALAKATFEAIMIHRNDIVVDGNDELAKLVGRPLEDLIGRSIHEFLRDGKAIAISEIVKLNDDARHEISIALPDGELVPVAARGRDIVIRGEKARVGCFVDLRERREAEKRIRHLALHDPLTSLPNRVLFTESLCDIAARQGEVAGCGVLIMDLDRFKDINDIHGHLAGDTVIRAIAARLQAVAGPDDIVARLGGDEFAAIVCGVSTPEELEEFGNRILSSMASPITIRPGERVNVTVSIGAALYGRHASEVDALIGCADTALFHAKNSGRNACRVFRNGMNALLEKRRALESDLEPALRQGQFEIYLQPRVTASDALIGGYEALLRWNHPERGMVSPADFIPVAEASGKIVQLGEWVLAEALKLLDTVDGHISVNVSPLQFRQRDFVANLAELIRRSGADVARLELEITESVLIDDDRRALQVLSELKAMGVSIALDDFGTGYSSLSYLSRYPFDAIKIDRSFVSNVTATDTARMIVRTIIALGTGLGMKVVAEGVETIEEARFLCDAGCHELQGYLLGRPVPVAGVAAEVDPALKRQLLDRRGAGASAGSAAQDLSSMRARRATFGQERWAGLKET